MSYTIKTIELFLTGVLLEAYTQLPSQKECRDIPARDVMPPTYILYSKVNSAWTNLELLLYTLY